jgi:hypothetical protein
VPDPLRECKSVLFATVGARFFERFAHRFRAHRFDELKPSQLVAQQLQRPAVAAFWRIAAAQQDQVRFGFAVELASYARTRTPRQRTVFFPHKSLSDSHHLTFAQADLFGNLQIGLTAFRMSLVGKQ